jgi:hypothetical protein
LEEKCWNARELGACLHSTGTEYPLLSEASCENFANITPIIGRFEVPSLQNADGLGVEGN